MLVNWAMLLSLPEMVAMLLSLRELVRKLAYDVSVRTEPGLEIVRVELLPVEKAGHDSILDLVVSLLRDKRPHCFAQLVRARVIPGCPLTGSQCRGTIGHSARSRSRCRC